MSIKNPQIINLPAFGADEEIEKIECGFRCSAVVTTYGRLLVSDPFERKNSTKDEPAEESKRKDSFKEEKGGKKKTDKQKDRKERDEKISEKEKEKEKDHRWEDITFMATSLK